MVGVTAEEFIQPQPSGGPSKHELFHSRLARILNVSLENVDVFTVLHSPHNSNASLLDVRFSAHGSPYRHPEKLNAAVGLNKAVVSSGAIGFGSLSYMLETSHSLMFGECLLVQGFQML
jgi:hypothetical protein